MISWNALISGYVEKGHVEKAIDSLKKMQLEGQIMPDAVTFLCVLNACSHAGLVKEGEKLFDELSVAYCITPTLEHYTCMVDLFGRAGCFDTVNALLDKVPHSGHLPLLRSILAACRKWRNVKLGKWAFEQVLQSDEKNAAAYVSMANIYASAGIQMDVNKAS